jgi:Uma2 family endonuclease
MLRGMSMGEPVWSLATLFPSQGDWSEEEYLALSAEHPRVEFSDGFLEVLPMPTDRHQVVLTALLIVLLAFAQRVGGRVRPAGLRVRLRAGRYREPDLVFLTAERLHLRGEAFWSGADLVVEVVSGSAEDRVRDCVTKRREYAEAGIREYWLADPERETLTVLKLDGERYVEPGVFARGDAATSASFEGLTLDVSGVFDTD